MAPALVRSPFHREGWVYEEKVDGWRMLAYKELRALLRDASDGELRAVIVIEVQNDGGFEQFEGLIDHDDEEGA